MNDTAGLSATAPQSPVLIMTLRRAAAFAQQRSHRYVTLEHLLLALMDDQDAVLLLRDVNADIESLRARAADVVNRFLSTLYAPGNTDLRPSYKLDRILQIATSGAGKSYAEVDGAFVVAALTTESDSVAAGLLRQYGLGVSQAMGWIYANRSKRKHAPYREAPAPDAPSSSRAASPRSFSEPKLEDMLSNSRQMHDRQDRGLKDVNKPAPAPARHVPPASLRPEQRHNGQVKSQPQSETPFNVAAFAPVMQPSPPPRYARKLSNALDNVRPATSPEQPQPVSAARALVVSKASGKLTENIPRKMRKGGAALIEVRISREETVALFQDLQGQSAADAHDVIVTRAMTVTLKAPDGGFTIETVSAETQWIFDRPSFLETERFGRWRWTLTPTASGARRLQLVASARSIDDNGMSGDVVMPDQTIEVRVRANYGRGFRKLLLWIFLLITGAVLGETALRFGPQIIQAVGRSMR
ncbi:MAG: Clp protease N-terminal domain-containing protein [Hyphomicrobiales bacterium]|nr:Clp protease N-terminal domain-containing protein [Hyphomicrobiales bacterium]